jgi:energy-coupling factor transporter ATP-binding protein EcfA2
MAENAPACLCRLDKVTLTNGAAIPIGHFTVAIGPNNGGKSRFLREIASAIAEHQKPRISVREVQKSYPIGHAQLVEHFAKLIKVDSNGTLVCDTALPYLTPAQVRLQKPVLAAAKESPTIQSENLFRAVGSHFVAHLKTENRLLLVSRKINRQEGYEGFQSPMEAAFNADADTEEWINDRVRSAFGVELILDRAQFARIEYKIWKSEPLPEDKAKRKLAIDELETLDDQGDGIRSFCGTIVTVATMQRPIILVDEPEAFLHPPQAFLMGRALAELRARGNQIIIATHSSDVLRGILSVTTEATVIRFSKEESSFTSKILDSGKLQDINADPVLSSTRVLDGLFYSGVIIVESDGDVVLYRAVLDQIDNSASIHFVNSYAKQFSSKLATPFHSMGVPCAIVVDFDALRIGEEFKRLYVDLGGDWSKIQTDYSALRQLIEKESDSQQEIANILALVAEIQSEIGKQGNFDQQLTWANNRLKSTKEAGTPWDKLKEMGMAGLSTAAQEFFQRINAETTKHGLFIVPAGERESWLTPDVPYSKRNKRAWTEQALEYLAAKPLVDTHPLRGFVSQIYEMLISPAAALNRK